MDDSSSALISFVSPGSPQQAVGGLFVTSFFLVIFLVQSPYANTTLDIMQAVSLISQAATLFCESPSAVSASLPRAVRRADGVTSVQMDSSFPWRGDPKLAVSLLL